VRHQAEIVFDQSVSGVHIALGAAFQAVAFLGGLQRAGERTAPAGQAEREEQAVHHQVDDRGKHMKTPPKAMYSRHARPYSALPERAAAGRRLA